MDGMKARQIYRIWSILKLVNQKCIETYTYIRFISFSFQKRMNRLSKGLLQQKKIKSNASDKMCRQFENWLPQ